MTTVNTSQDHGHLSRLVQEAYAPKLGRPLTEEEAAEFAMHFRRLAAFLIDCARDPVLMERLGHRRPSQPSATPRVLNNTTRQPGGQVPASDSAESVAPTGVSSPRSDRADASTPVPAGTSSPQGRRAGAGSSTAAKETA